MKSAKADLTLACRALRPAVSQTLQQSAFMKDQLYLFSAGDTCSTYTAKEGDSRLFQGHIKGPVITARGHPHVGVTEKITMLRKPGHTAGYVGQSGG